MAIKKEKADEITKQLHALHPNFSIQVDGDTNQVKALTSEIRLKSDGLRKLAEISSGTYFAIKRSGNKVRFSFS